MKGNDTGGRAHNSVAAGATAAEQMADFASSLSFGDIPDEVIAKVRYMLLDTIGICIGSSRLGLGDLAMRAAEHIDGTGSCTAVGHPNPLGSHASVFVNGVLAHAQDFDDTHTETLLHPSCVLVPAMLAAAERSNCSGAQALVALVAGYEVALRIARVADQQLNERGFQTTAVAGTFGAALIAGMCAGFDRQRLVNALGLAGSVIATGVMECVPAGSSAKQTHPGWAAHCGLMASDLAAAGFSGPSTIFEGPLGILNSYLHAFDADKGDLNARFGNRWDVLNVRPKLYPCGHPIHAHIECALAFLRDRPGEASQIEKIICEVPPGALKTVCEPWERKVKPSSAYDARFSLPFAVAGTLITGQAGFEVFSDTYIHDQRVLALTRLVRPQAAEDLHLGDMSGRMHITLRDGSLWSHQLGEVRGGRRTPISEAELLMKFHQMADGLPREQTDRLSSGILRFEKLPRIADLMMELRHI